MLKALYENPHGFAGIYDELAAFLKSFNKYKPGGGDEEVMLSLFNGKSISVNRKNSEPIFIEKPFISIIGSIQPQVLINLLGNNKIDNGFTHRFLFAFPDSVIREDLSDDDIPEHIEELYQTFIDRILIADFFQADSYPAQKINLSKDGYEAYKIFRRKINETINNEKSDAISGIYAKLDTYSLRIALILHVMRMGCHEPGIDPYQVSADTFCKAAELIEYFEHSALKVFNLMEKFRDPLNGYPMEHKIIYYQLPYSFTTSAAWEIAKEKVSRRTLGFELRSPNFKSTVSPKDFTFLNTQKPDAVAVFEGFIDFLSIALCKQILPELTNFLVLNSLSFFEKARPVMEQHERIYLLLDNDAAGKNCTKHALGLSYKYNDLSERYQQDKDINEWLMKKKESEQHHVHRSGRRM